MSMTREEAIEILKNHTQYFVPVQDLGALNMAITTLRPVSREQVAKLSRCEHCKDGKSFDGQVVIMGNKGMFPMNFCPWCGSPLTDEAVQMVMERLEALYEV